MTDQQPQTAAGQLALVITSQRGVLAPRVLEGMLRLIPKIEAEAVEAEAKSCSFRCDGESRHDGPHFFYYDGPQLIGLLEEINAEPLDVDRGEFPDAP